MNRMKTLFVLHLQKNLNAIKKLLIFETFQFLDFFCLLLFPPRTKVYIIIALQNQLTYEREIRNTYLYNIRFIYTRVQVLLCFVDHVINVKLSIH